MRITVFTSNQARHISLIEKLADVADEVFAVVESVTVFPGVVADFYAKSETMQKYFTKVIHSEQEVFGTPRFLPKNVHVMPLKLGDLNNVAQESLKDALSSDRYIVFGASYIKGELIDFLVEQKALNIHMGTSPYYRGSACNFWAAYDKNPEYIGATIHQLSKGLDSGNILFHALPKDTDDPFLLGMEAVKAAHKGLIARIKDKSIDLLTPVAQDKTQQIRYSRYSDFTEEVALNYLENLPKPDFLLQKLKKRDFSKFLAPYIG